MPNEYWIWQMVQETGWTLDYIDALPVGTFYEWLAVKDGEAKGRRSNVAENSKPVR